jgi:thymidylate synthase (FAD)
MKLIKPSHQILASPKDALLQIEQCAKTCYKSEPSQTIDKTEQFVANLIKRGHHSTLEHASMSVRFICDRGVSHELVRHRLVAVSQESTRYCNYSGGVTFILPPWVDITPGDYFMTGNEPQKTTQIDFLWLQSMVFAEKAYMKLLDAGWSPQQARGVLPNSLKTEIVMTANIREWRHILALRATGIAGAPHPQMKELMQPLLDELKLCLPTLFNDI